MFSNRMIFEPPMEVRSGFYKCSPKFHLDTIVNMYIDHRVDGVVFTNGEICTWYHYKNQSLKQLTSQKIELQSQTRRGGQSAKRYARNRDIKRDHYVTELAEKTIELFFDKNTNVQTITHLILCGPAEFKCELSEHKLLTNNFENIHIVTMADMNIVTLANSIDDFDDPLEKSVLDQIRKMVETADPRLVFGDEIIDALKNKQIKTLYVHTNVDLNNFMNLDISSMFDYNISVVNVSSHSINNYGGAIGVKFY